MTQARGANALLAIQAESTFATDPGSPSTTKVYFVSESLRLSQALIDSRTITSARNPSLPVTGDKDIAGSIAMELQAYPGLLLKALLGSVTTTGSGPYVHTIKIGSSVPSLLIEKGFTDLSTPQYFKYNGCKVNRATFRVRPSGFQDVSFDFIGAKETVGTSSFDATPTDLGKSPFDGFKINSITEGGSATAIVTEADITVENNLDGSIYTINPSAPGTRYSLPEGTVKVSGRIVALFESITLYTKATASTESSLAIVYQIGTGTGAAGNEKLTITIPELIFQPQAPVVVGPTGVMCELPFVAYYANDAAASAIHMELKNTETTL